MLVPHQFEISPFRDKVRRVPHVKGVEYQVGEVPLARSPAAVRRMNPAGKLPCLEHDGHFVSDSTDIRPLLLRDAPALPAPALRAVLDPAAGPRRRRALAPDLAVFAQLACVRGTQEGAEILAEATRVSSWMERVDEVSAPAGH